MDPVTRSSRWGDDPRCDRNDGKGWRCRLLRFGGSRYCEYHLQYLKRKHKADPWRRVKAADPRRRVRAADLSEANAKIEEPAAARGRGYDPPLKVRKRRGRPPKAKNVGESSDARVSDRPTEWNKRPFDEDNLESSFANDNEDDKCEEDENDEADEDCRAYRARVSYHSAEKKKRPVGRPRKRSIPSEIDTERRGEDEKAIGVLKLGQVWAFSEESDGSPPRSYARIDRIVGSFVEVTPLVPHLILKEDVLFAEKGLSLACGVFNASQSSLIKKVSAFTHRIPFEKDEDQNSYYRIFPKKGEIWAVYLQWDDLKRRFEYRLVEIVSDFSEENGVNAFWLSCVEGKDGVYQRQVHDGFYLARCFSRGFMPMFSHRLPASRIVEDSEILWNVELR